MCTQLQRARASCVEVSTRYGPAFVITTGCLSVICFWAIFIALSLSGFQIRPYLLPYKNWLDSFNSKLFPILETGGSFAVAFALNRLLSPLRFCASLALVPYTAPRINRFYYQTARPWYVRSCPSALTPACCFVRSDRQRHQNDDDHDDDGLADQEDFEGGMDGGGGESAEHRRLRDRNAGAGRSTADEHARLSDTTGSIEDAIRIGSATKSESASSLAIEMSPLMAAASLGGAAAPPAPSR